MAQKIIFLGARERKDSFNGIPYHNLNVYYAFLIPDDGKFGVGFEINGKRFKGKIKFDDIPSVFGEDFRLSELNDNLFKPIEVSFDFYGNPKTIRFIDDE